MTAELAGVGKRGALIARAGRRAAHVGLLARELFHLGQDVPDARRLAAPQVGESKRIIVLDPDHEEPGKHLLKLINPRVLEAEGKIIWEEGCLSVIDYSAEVERAAKVLVRAWTPEQKEIEIEAEELLAVALQHEIDHLDGKLFIDRISRIKRELYRRKLKKMIKEGKADERPSTVRI